MLQRDAHHVTIVDVAREAGVSKSTAARVMAGRGSVSVVARIAVTQSAAKLGYSPNALAKAIKSGTSNTIGVVIPDVANPFFSAAIRGISDAARSAGYGVIISNTDNDPDLEARSIGLLLEKRVDGLIIAPVFQRYSAAMQVLAFRKVPTVFLDRRGPTTDAVPLVSLNNVAASALATDHLIQLGHTRVAIVTEALEPIEELLAFDRDATELRPSSQRLLGHLRALRRHGVDVDPDLIIRAAYDEADANEQVRRLLRTFADVTALFETDSVLTTGTYRAICDLGLQYPEDISFVGFDDQDWSTIVRPSVTVVSQPRYRLGATAGTCLVERIHHPDATLDDIQLSATLIIRESTATVPARSRR